MSNSEDLNQKLEIVEGKGVQESDKPSTSGMSGDRPQRRAGRRPGRRGSKMDERAKLERSRQSARECRARKKLRYQYLEDLVANREKAVFALRDELELFKQWSIQIDKGLMPLALLKLTEDDDVKDVDIKKMLDDVVVISDSDESVQSDNDIDNDLQQADTSVVAPTSSNGITTSGDDLGKGNPTNNTGPVKISDHTSLSAHGSSGKISAFTNTTRSKQDCHGLETGASGSYYDICIQPGQLGLRLNLDNTQFGTLDENLKFASESPVDLDRSDIGFQFKEETSEEKGADGSAWNPTPRTSLPTIVEENEL